MAAMAMKVSLAPDARRIVTGTGPRGPIFAGSASMRILIAGTQVQIVRMPLRRKTQRQDAHADQVGAMDALEARGQHRAYAEQRHAFRGPVARRAHAIALARHHDDGGALAGVALGGAEQRQMLARADMNR